MDNGPTLIERAAALLRDSGSPVEPRQIEPRPFAIDSPAAPKHSLRPLSRHCILDRAALAEAGVIMPWLTTSRVVEEFRIVKGHLIENWRSVGSSLSRASPRAVMVTSARPREGKSFSSINLAFAFAAEEKLTVILIDADPVRGGVGKSLNVPSVPGLTSILTGEVSLSDALVQTDVPNLLILPSGEPGPHIPELLTGGGASNVFAELVRRYPEHVIVIDTPPVLASTTPAGLTPFVAQIVFVVEAGHTQRPEIEAAIRLLRGCEHISFLLNKATQSSEHFGSYPYYGSPDDTPGKAATD